MDSPKMDGGQGTSPFKKFNRLRVNYDVNAVNFILA
jgi:hypothetical protein